jgi:hypothetical protein
VLFILFSSDLAEKENCSFCDNAPDLKSEDWGIIHFVEVAPIEFSELV